jgi:phage/plasmid-associated DNA primase
MDVNPKQWLNQLDDNDYLMGFEDCVYDFHERCFREGRPEDMISMSTGHKQSDVETHMAGSKICDDIINAVESMQQSEEALWYVLNNIATSVVGNRPNDRFQTWSGSAANGKGLTKNLVASVFGDYYYEPSAGLFASRSVSGRVLSSELAKRKGKRICVASEAEPGDKLRAGLLK